MGPSQTIPAKEAFKRLIGREELAFLDVRESGQFGEGHPFFAVPCPFSSFEKKIERLVPKKNVPVFLIDAGDGISGQAALRAQRLGYSEIFTIDGGIQGWELSGARLFKGVNVPSKTLGELAEHYLHPETISAQALQTLITTDQPLGLFDCRPPSEYQQMTIPGARSAPNGELALRHKELVGNDQLPIVVTCAGRTRGILGALGLKLAGLKNPIYALENGTQGWALSHLPLKRENQPGLLPKCSPASISQAKKTAEQVFAKLGVSRLTAHDATNFLGQEDKTTYLFDIRSEQEYLSQHCPLSKHVWGVQLVQATDQWIGVRHSRVILIDDTGLRAAIASAWLQILGYQVYFLNIEDALKINKINSRATFGIKKEVSFADFKFLKKYSPKEAMILQEQGKATLIDGRVSVNYRKFHARNSVWLIRSKVSKFLEEEGTSKTFILLDSEPDRFYGLVETLSSLGAGSLGYVEGGLNAWRSDELPIDSSDQIPADQDCIDFLFFTHGRHDGNLEASKLYLEWEKSLIERLHPEELKMFNLERLRDLKKLL